MRLSTFLVTAAVSAFALAAEARPACEAIFKRASEKALRPELEELNYMVLAPQHKKTIVMLHGMSGDMSSYFDMAPDLAREFRVVIYDMRAHGGSLVQGSDYSTVTMASDLLALFNHLNIDKAFVVGHSMGGRVAARFTAMHPERVQRLLIEDMDLIQRTSRHPEKMRRALLKAAEVRRRLTAKYYSREDYVAALAPFFNRSDLEMISEAVGKNYEGEWSIGPFPPDVVSLFWNQGNVDNIIPDLAKTRVPTLFLKADTRKFWSAMTPAGDARIRQAMPESRIVTIPDAEHSVHNTQYNPFIHHLREFFRADEAK